MSIFFNIWSQMLVIKKLNLWLTRWFLVKSVKNQAFYVKNPEIVINKPTKRQIIGDYFPSS